MKKKNYWKVFSYSVSEKNQENSSQSEFSVDVEPLCIRKS